MYQRIINNKYKIENGNVEPILYKVTARHLAIIFNAFPNLKSLDNENRDYIKNNFLDFVLENQGWNEYLVLINGKPTPLDPDSFKKITVSYLDEEYKMKPIDKKEDNKEMDNFPQLVFNQQDMTNNLIDRPSFGAIFSIFRQTSQSKNN